MSAAYQPSLLDVIAEDALERPVRALYGSSTRGHFARAAEYAAWIVEYGHFGSIQRAHAWHPYAFRPQQPIGRCQVAVLSADLRCLHYSTPCACVGDLVYRGSCLGCTWEGPVRGRENEAAEDALDHAWPGWATVPVVDRVPEEKKKRARWEAAALGVYSSGWLEAGGPIRTWRSAMGNRHVEKVTPWGGYDVGVIREETADG